VSVIISKNKEKFNLNWLIVTFNIIVMYQRTLCLYKIVYESAWGSWELIHEISQCPGLVIREKEGCFKGVVHFSKNFCG